jgi:hypothetical protein
MGRKQKPKTGMMLTELLYKLKLIDKVNKKQLSVLDIKSKVNDFLEARGTTLGVWYKSFSNFFREAHGYYSYSTLQHFMAERMKLDPMLTEKKDRRAFFGVIGEKNGYAERSKSISTWIDGSVQPTFGQLLFTCAALDIQIKELDLLDEVASMRFAIARAASYVNAYPWKKLPDNETEYYKYICEQTKITIKKLPFLGSNITDLSIYINQPVFDIIVTNNIDAVIFENQIGKLHKLLASESEEKSTERNDRLLDSFNLTQILLIFGDFSVNLNDYVWAWKKDDARYNALWGYE